MPTDCVLLQWPKRLNAPLTEVDPELVDIIEKEKNRQWKVRSFSSDIKDELQETES